MASLGQPFSSRTRSGVGPAVVGQSLFRTPPGVAGSVWTIRVALLIITFQPQQPQQPGAGTNVTGEPSDDPENTNAAARLPTNESNVLAKWASGDVVRGQTAVTSDACGPLVP